VAAVALGIEFSGTVYDYTDTVDGVNLPQVDAIVVLAGGRGRLAAAGDLWSRYRGSEHEPTLYFSGVGSQTTFKVIQSQLRSGVSAVLKPEQVVLENESTNTEENARLLAKNARTRGWKKVLLVTSRYHMKRARLIFGKVLETNLPADVVGIETLSVYQEPFEPGEWIWSPQGIRVTVGEYLKWLYYSRVWKP